MPWGKWGKGETTDTKVGVDKDGNMTSLTRNVDQRGDKNDYPHMSVTVNLEGEVTNAHWSESENGPRIGTERKPDGSEGEWKLNPTVDKGGTSRDTPSMYDASNFHDRGYDDYG